MYIDDFIFFSKNLTPYICLHINKNESSIEEYLEMKTDDRYYNELKRIKKDGE